MSAVFCKWIPTYVCRFHSSNDIDKVFRVANYLYAPAYRQLKKKPASRYRLPYRSYHTAHLCSIFTLTCYPIGRDADPNDFFGSGSDLVVRIRIFNNNIDLF